jgi:hypothetical protein
MQSRFLNVITLRLSCGVCRCALTCGGKLARQANVWKIGGRLDYRRRRRRRQRGSACRRIRRRQPPWTCRCSPPCARCTRSQNRKVVVRRAGWDLKWKSRRRRRGELDTCGGRGGRPRSRRSRPSPSASASAAAAASLPSSPRSSSRSTRLVSPEDLNPAGGRILSDWLAAGDGGGDERWPAGRLAGGGGDREK